MNWLPRPRAGNCIRTSEAVNSPHTCAGPEAAVRALKHSLTSTYRLGTQLHSRVHAHRQITSLLARAARPAGTIFAGVIANYSNAAATIRAYSRHTTHLRTAAPGSRCARRGKQQNRAAGQARYASAHSAPHIYSAPFERSSGASAAHHHRIRHPGRQHQHQHRRSTQPSGCRRIWNPRRQRHRRSRRMLPRHR